MARASDPRPLGHIKVEKPPADFVSIVRALRERVAAYETGGQIPPGAEAAAGWPRDTSLRRILHRLGFLRGLDPTPGNRRRMAALLLVLREFEPDKNNFFPRLRDYTDAANPLACCVEQPCCARCDLQLVCTRYGKQPTIKDLPPGQRPRERLLQSGESALSEAELLAIIIRDGAAQMSALDLGRRIMSEYGNLANLARASAQELSGNKNLKGIGPAKAAQIRAAMALAQRYGAHPLPFGEAYTSSKQIFAHYGSRLAALEEEVFICMFLDTKNRLIAEREIFRGGQNTTWIDAKTVFKEALRSSASAVIFVHNHPSGDCSPSPDDKHVTSHLRETGELLGLRVLDHIIIGRGAFYSFAAKGWLK